MKYLLLTICLLAPLPLSAQEAEGSLAGRIIATFGEPSLYRGVKELSATNLSKIYANDSIRCLENQSVKILLEDGSVLVIAPESELRIAEVDFAFAHSRRQLELELVSGKTKFVITPFLSEKADVVVSTPAASIRVNNGTFVAEHDTDDEQTRVTVLRGQLLLRNLFAEPKAAITVKERYSSEVRTSSAPTPPILVDDEAFTSLQNSLRLSLPKLQDPATPLGNLISKDLARISGTTIRLNGRPNLPVYGARPSLENVDRVNDDGTRNTPKSGNITIRWTFPKGTSLRENSR